MHILVSQMLFQKLSINYSLKCTGKYYFIWNDKIQFLLCYRWGTWSLVTNNLKVIIFYLILKALVVIKYSLVCQDRLFND